MLYLLILYIQLALLLLKSSQTSFWNLSTPLNIKQKSSLKQTKNGTNLDFLDKGSFFDSTKKDSSFNKPLRYWIVTTRLAVEWKNTSAKRYSETHVPFTLSSLAFRKSQNLVKSGVIRCRSDTALGCVLPFSIPLL